MASLLFCGILQIGQGVLREFDQLTARLAERNAASSDEEITADVAAVLREVRVVFSLPDGGAS
jgi:hypothetical protein